MAKRKEPDGPLDALPPNNPAAEATVIAAMLIDAEAVPVCLGILKPEDFFQERHARMFQAAAEWKLPPPTLRDLRDAGNLEQDADVVILLSQMTEPTGAGLVDVLCQVAKNREGETGRCTLLFNRPRQQMWEQEERPGFGPASGETEP